MSYVERIQLLNFVLSLGSMLVALILFVFAFRRRKMPGVIWFVLLCGNVTWVLLFYSLEVLAGSDLSLFLTLSKLEYLAITLTPLAWLTFAWSFTTGMIYFNKKIFVVLAIVPIITICLAFTNELHGLIWTVPKFKFVNGVPIFAPEYGSWFYLYVVYNYILLFIGTIVLLMRARLAWEVYRLQALLVLAGALVPWLGNVFAIFDDLNPLPEIWLNALFLGFSMLMFSFALFRLRLLEFLPLVYQTIFNNVPDGIIVLDLQHHVIALNAEVIKFYQNKLPPSLGKSIFEIFPEQVDFLKAVVDKEDYQVDFVLNDVPLSLRVAVMHDSRRKLIGRLLIITNITAETAVKSARRDAEIFAETMRDITSILNSTLDTNRVFYLLLENMQRIVAHDASNIMIYDPMKEEARIQHSYGYPAEMDAQLRTRLFPLKDFWTLRTAATQKTPLIVPDTFALTEWTTLEQVPMIASFACAPIFVDEQLVGFINLDCWLSGKLQNDIGNRLQLIAQQAASAFRNARLYEQTRTQATELEHSIQSLEKVYGQVRDLEKLKSDMIRVAAHDLKNPLNVVMSYSSMLYTMPEYVPEDTTKVYQLMFESAQRMNQIINDFLSLERISKIAQELTINPFNINDLIERADAEFSGQITKKKLSLTTFPSAEPCFVIGDEVLAYEALANFVSNALKYTPEGGTIQIELSTTEQAARLSVKDSGMGIPELAYQHLFDAFYRAPNAKESEIEGTGLGLHLTRNIIERQQGRVFFESKVGKGSTFSFELPLYQQPLFLS